jgi:hypothetical protein
MNWKLCLCITTESTPMTGMGSHSVLRQDAGARALHQQPTYTARANKLICLSRPQPSRFFAWEWERRKRRKQLT